jgi:hypothetical protein
MLLPPILKHKGILGHWSEYPPGSVERAKSLAMELFSTFKNAKASSDLWLQVQQEAAAEQIWEPLGLPSLDDLVVKLTGCTTEEVTRRKVQEARDKPLPSSNQAEAPRNPAGRKGKESDRDSTRLVDRSSDYLLRRLARDCPELLDRIESGELSVNAAAIQAGIRKKLSHAEQCVRAFDKAPDKLSIAASILERLEPQERNALLVRFKARRVDP